MPILQIKHLTLKVVQNHYFQKPNSNPAFLLPSFHHAILNKIYTSTITVIAKITFV